MKEWVSLLGETHSLFTLYRNLYIFKSHERVPAVLYTVLEVKSMTGFGEKLRALRER